MMGKWSLYHNAQWLAATALILVPVSAQASQDVLDEPSIEHRTATELAIEQFDLAALQAAPVSTSWAALASEPEQVEPAGRAPEPIGPSDPDVIPSPLSTQDPKWRLPKDIKRLHHIMLGSAVLDTATTVYCLEAKRCAEANPLLGPNPNTLTIVLVKAASTGVVSLISTKIAARNRGMARFILIFQTVLNTAAAGNNLRFVF